MKFMLVALRGGLGVPEAAAACRGAASTPLRQRTLRRGRSVAPRAP